MFDFHKCSCPPVAKNLDTKYTLVTRLSQYTMCILFLNYL